MAVNRSIRRFARGKSQYIWAAVIIDRQTINSTAFAAPIVQGSDWAAGVVGITRATVLAVRGWLSYANTDVTNNNAMFMYVRKGDIAGVPLTPVTITAYTDEDIMWTGGYTNVQTTTTAGRKDWEIDIGARRRIDNNDVVELVADMAGATAAGVMSGVLRGLVKLG